MKTTRPPPEDLVVFCKPKTIIFVPYHRIYTPHFIRPERGLQKIQVVVPEQPAVRLPLESAPGHVQRCIRLDKYLKDIDGFTLVRKKRQTDVSKETSKGKKIQPVKSEWRQYVQR